MSSKGLVRDRILDAAVNLLRDSGVKRLAQPQVAKAANVPQGHLTYYFPKKSDMLMAVAARFLQMLSQDPVLAEGSTDGNGKASHLLRRLILDRTRTRMLLGLTVEADADEELRATMLRGADFTRKSIEAMLGFEENSAEGQLALAIFWGLSLQQFLLCNDRSPEQVEALLEQAIQALQHIARSKN